MCPSYRVTQEERHSTRGRARLLFEMLHGEADREIAGATRPSRTRSILCLACKGCKSDCPVNVDMATYKAEFLSHYYEGRLRPRHAYAYGARSTGRARLASLAPGLANLVDADAGALPTSIKWRAASRRGGLCRPSPARPSTHGSGAADATRCGRGAASCSGPTRSTTTSARDVPLRPLEVLEAAGFEVAIPPRPLCCGRPLYDWGMLGHGQALLAADPDSARAPRSSRHAVVGLEPAV